MNRVTFTLTDALSAVVEEHPDQLDLDPNLSQSKRYAVLVEEGAACVVLGGLSVSGLRPTLFTLLTRLTASPSRASSRSRPKTG